ncbi:MAG: AMP-binding protein [Labilithrix sp.]|nr:AMP-binding protein [Labilithrix sp.]
MNVAHLLRRIATAEPRRPALFEGDRCVADYGAFAERAARLAAGLRDELGLRAGDRVALFMENCPQYLEVLYGAWWAGLVAVPVNAKLHPSELDWILGDCEASALFVTSSLPSELTVSCPVFDARSPEPLLRRPPRELEHREPRDPAWLFYTSGTTGRPKGVTLSHRNLLAMTTCYFSDVDAVSEDHAVVYAAPMSHGAGLYNFPHVLKGARHVVPASGGFDPEELCVLARSVGRLSMFAAPTMVRRLVDHVEKTGADCAGFETIVYGGGPMYVEDIKRALAVMGQRFVQIYGQGECPMAITALSREHLAAATHPRWEARLASVGWAQSVSEVRIEGGGVGEVLVRGDAVMEGYWRNPEATANALRDGWLCTGDVGELDADGFLTLKDRSKDLIISGGSNIYPREVEEVLLQHPEVREVSVVGWPDAEWGERVVAFVVGDATEAELDALCLSHIARFKRPREYRFVAELPKNHYGKVLKTELRARGTRRVP